MLTHPLRLALLVGALAALAAAPTMAAHDATPVAVPAHPIIGAWEVRTTSDQFPGLLFAIFTADGVYLQVEYVPPDEARSPIGVGTWQATGERSADAMYWVMLDEEETHVMAWLSLEVFVGDTTLSGTISTLIMDALGGVAQQATATLSGSRLKAEPNLVGG